MKPGDVVFGLSSSKTFPRRPYSRQGLPSASRAEAHRRFPDLRVPTGADLGLASAAI